MRRVVLAFIFCLLLASGDASAAGPDRPIPQDPAKLKKKYDDLLAWNRKTLAGDYEKVGKKDPKWDKPARDALENAARLFSLQVDPLINPRTIYAQAKQAFDAGCDDPMILYLRARMAFPSDFPDEEAHWRCVEDAGKAMATSGYIPHRKAVAHLLVAVSKTFQAEPTPKRLKEAAEGLDQIMDLLPKSAAVEEHTVRWQERWLDTLASVIAARKKLGTDHLAAFNAVDARIAEIPGLEALRLENRGKFYNSYAWASRGLGFANSVPEDAARKFVERNEEARKALIAAWKLRPTDTETAALMLGIEKDIGGDRDAMETWFERAMVADPTNQTACWGKLDWLDPKWHGSVEDMLAFGKACVATKNWRSGITLLGADAHLRVATRLQVADQVRYLRQPEVWAEIGPVYDEFLKHYPNNHEERTRYASLCYLASKLDEAHKQFQILGDNLVQHRHFPSHPVSALQKMRAVAAKAVEAQPLK